MTINEFIKIMRKLQKMGIDISKITANDTIETLAQKSGIDRDYLEKWAKKENLDVKYKIGLKKTNISQAYRGKGLGKKPTEKQVEILQKLGISLEKKDNIIDEFIDILEKLQEFGVDISQLTQKDTIKTLAQKSGIEVNRFEEWANKNNLNIEYKIGLKRTKIAQAYRGQNKKKKPTEDQVKKLQKLGIILEKQDKETIQDFIGLLERLKLIGVDISKISTKDTIETLAVKSGIDKENLEELEKEHNLDKSSRVGLKKSNIIQSYKGKGTYKKPTDEQVDKLKQLGINLEEHNKLSPIGLKKNSIVHTYRGKGTLKKQNTYTIQYFIETIKKLKLIGIDVSEINRQDTIETLAQRAGIDREYLEKWALENNINIKWHIGYKEKNIANVYRGEMKGIKPTKEQIRDLAELGINLEKKDSIKEFIDITKKLKHIGVDTSKLKTTDTIETLARKSGIYGEDLEKLAQEHHFKINETIGRKKDVISQIYRGNRKGRKPTEEQVKRLKELGINLERLKRTGKEIAEASISSIKDIEMADKEDEILKDYVKKIKREEFDK